MGGSLELNEILSAIQKIQQIQKIGNFKFTNFVETGTYKADTSIMASKHFSHVYTTEIVPDLYQNSKDRAEKEGIENITFLLGDSVKLLDDIMSKLNGDTVFFLDAHQSGNDTSNNGINVPILNELDVILKYSIGPSLFIIDDLRLWKSQVWDWQHISSQAIFTKILLAGHRIVGTIEYNDRYYVLTNGNYL